MSQPAASRSLTKRILADAIKSHREELARWYAERAAEAPPPFYCSVDLRDAGYKIVPVDSNLYPAGFNNICPDDQMTAPAIIRREIDRALDGTGRKPPERIVVVPEAHTQNRYYIENLWYLTQLLKNAGFDVRVGWYGPLPEGTEAPLKLVSVTDKVVEAWPLSLEGGVASAGDFVPDLLLLNNDFSSGYPKPLDAVTQPILPSHRLGWHSRKKSEHFEHYNRLAGEFARIIGVDPWLIQVDTEEVSPVNFDEDQGTDLVAAAVERILERTRAAYERQSITQKPFVFVKNNHGTYGMGIMVAHSVEDIRGMNRRSKHKMSVGKNRLAIDSVAVQEGIPTATVVGRLAAEPVIYLVGTELIGGFLRTNTEKGVEDNLNSQGMVFRKLCMSDLRRSGLEGTAEDEDLEEVTAEPVLELVYGSIARLSALATGLELQRLNPSLIRG